MAWLEITGIIVGLAIFIIMSMRGHSVLISAPIAAIIIILTNQMDFWTYLVDDPTNSFLAGMGSFVYGNALLFILSSVVGKYIDQSGAAVSIAQKIMKLTGDNNPFWILVGIAAVGLILTYGGVSLFVVMFALIPIARPCFKAANMPWHLFMAAFAVGATGITMAMLPGSPSLMLVNICNACDVPVTAAPEISIICSIICLALSLVYFKYAVKKSKARGETYDCILPETEVSYDKLPNFWVALTPLLAMILVIIIGSAFGVRNVVYIGMAVSVVLCMILFNKFIDSHKKVLGEGGFDALGPLVFTATGVGVGAIAAASPGFMAIANLIFNMPGGTFVSAWTLAFVLGGVAGGGLGAVNIISQFFLEPYLATGVSAALLAKIIVVSAGTGGALPNAGAMFGMFRAMGLNHGNAYVHIFWIDIVIVLISTVVMILVGPLITP